MLLFYLKLWHGIPLNVTIHTLADILSVLAVIISVSIGLTSILNHLIHYKQPEYQRYDIRILLMMPIYAVCSAMSVFFKDVSVYVELVRDW